MLLSFSASRSATPRRWPALLRTVVLSGVLAGSLSACVPLMVTGVVGGLLLATDRRSSGAQLDDEAIEMRGSSRISTALQNRGSVSVTSYNRVVLLTGQAGNATDKATIEKLVREQATVRQVYNEIEVVPFTATLGQRSKDTMLTGQVKASLLNAKDIQGTAVKVVTENKVVYLMGIVTPRESKRAAEIARGVNDVSKVVRLFEVISEEELAASTSRAAPVVEDRSSMN